MKAKIIFSFLLIVIFVAFSFAQVRVSSLTIESTPNSSIWIDGIFRGKTNNSGLFKISPLLPGSKEIRVRADGFAQVSKPLAPGIAKLTFILKPTSDAAELIFQEGERTLKNDKTKAIELYKRAISLRSNYLEAHLALGRALTGEDNEAAHVAIRNARRIKPGLAEASAIEGRIFRDESEYDKAIKAWDRAIREGKGFQPEALTGLALLFKEEAENARVESAFDDETFYLNESAKSFETAINQLAASEPVVYFELGQVYELLNKPDKAIAVYQRFLKDFPDSVERSVAESYIKQLRIDLKPKTK